jgi:hypothetical protein
MAGQDKNCWICNEGIGRGLCAEHNTEVMAKLARHSGDLPLGVVDDSQLDDLCRAICLAPLGVY